ncbi:MAG: hypothetical protein AB8B96_19405 [Lysobacterales bacterium]
MARKTWQEKFDTPGDCVVKEAPKDFADIKAGQQMLLTTPKDIHAFVRTVPVGQSLSMKQLRAALAKASGADIACPVVTGIHLRTVAEVVNEQLAAGQSPADLTPVWRVIEPNAPITKKLEAGAEQFMTLRAAENAYAG